MKDPGRSQVLAEAFNGQAGVSEVTSQLRYVEPLLSALTVMSYIAVGIAVLMLIAATLLIGTTIRLSAYARRKEIGIMRLVGASSRFIQAPFVLEGVFAAFLGSALASAAVVAGVHFGVNGYLRGRVPFVTTWVTMRDAVLVVPLLIGIELFAPHRHEIQTHREEQRQLPAATASSPDSDLGVSDSAHPGKYQGSFTLDL